MKADVAPHPDRIALERATAPWSMPILAETAQDVLRQIRHNRRANGSQRLAPMPSGGDSLLGHLGSGRSDPLGSFIRWRDEVGDVVRLRMGGPICHLLCHPDLAREVLSEHGRRFIKPIHGRLGMARVMGNGLLVSEGSFWLRQRRIAQPAFHKQRIDGFAERMVHATADMLNEWERQRDGASFDVAKEMMRLTLRIVQETVLGTQPKGDSARIGDAVGVVSHELERRFSRIFAPPAGVPTKSNLRFKHSIGLLDRTVREIIAARRASDEPGQDLLSMLLESKDEETGEGMDDRQLRDEVMTFFLAGHETTANALAWTYYLLARHPEVARRMQSEAQRVLGDRHATAADVKDLEFTRMVFSEAIRLYPPAWVTVRAPIRDETVAGYSVPAGTRLFISPYVIHRHPDFWSDPEGFDPERFRDPKTIDKFAYIPFGGGRRLCIGHAFAMMEGILVLATIAQRFHLELISGQRIEPEPQVTLRPKYGIQVRKRPVA